MPTASALVVASAPVSCSTLTATTRRAYPTCTALPSCWRRSSDARSLLTSPSASSAATTESIRAWRSQPVLDCRTTGSARRADGGLEPVGPESVTRTRRC